MLPPLQSLSLEGYYIQGEESTIWKERFPWDKLRSLSLGVQKSEGFLESATGNVKNLK